MNREAFEAYRLRFGDDVAAWPAPYRQEALAMRAAGDGPEPADDDALDNLVRDAALMETDERELARQVLGRINAEPRFGMPFLGGLLLRPAAMGACAAALLVAATAGGYQAARLQGDTLDSGLLALAAGAPVLGDAIPGMIGDGAEEGNSL